MNSDTLALLPLWYVVFLLSLTCHEAAHAWVARLGGDETAYLGGQVSLNPMPHIRRELWGTVIIPLLSYVYYHWMMGWASAPYDPRWEDRHPRRAALMAAAGPAANLVLAAIGFAVLKAGLAGGIWIQPLDGVTIDRMVVTAGEQAAHWEGIGRLASILLGLNLVLLVFNLLPIHPLDGAAVLAGLFEPARRLRDAMRSNAMAGLIGILVAWTVFGRIFGIVFVPVLRLLYG